MTIRMTIRGNLVLLLAALLVAACSSAADPFAPAATLAPGETFLTTDASRYEVRLEGTVRAVDFELTYRNPINADVAVPACHSPLRPILQKLVDGEWVYAFSPVELACISPPLVIAGGAMHQFRYRLRADLHDLARWPGAADGGMDGTYRFFWMVGLHDRGADNGVGAPLPEHYVVSNPFELHMR